MKGCMLPFALAHFAVMPSQVSTFSASIASMPALYQCVLHKMAKRSVGCDGDVPRRCSESGLILLDVQDNGLLYLRVVWFSSI